LEVGARDVFVANAEDAEADRFEEVGAELVTGTATHVVVNGAVDLEHESEVGAEEVGDEAGDDLLPPEFESKHRTVAQQSPRRGFGPSRRAAKSARQLQLLPIDRRAPNERGPTPLSCAEMLTGSDDGSRGRGGQGGEVWAQRTLAAHEIDLDANRKLVARSTSD
jgi:hypothetical protein